MASRLTIYRHIVPKRKENGGVKRSGVTSRSSALQVNLREKENFLITLMYNKVFGESNSRGTIG